MSSIPYLKFYPGDWIRDTRALSASERGVWIDLICFMWHAPEPGVLTFSLSALGRMIGLPEKRTAEVLDALVRHRLLLREEVSRREIRLTCRRIVRDHAELTATATALSEKASRAARSRWGAKQQSEASAPAGSPARSGSDEEKTAHEGEWDAGPCAPLSDPSCLEQCTGNAIQKADGRRQRKILSLSPSTVAGQGSEPAASPCSALATPPRRPTLEQAHAAATTIGLTAEEAETWWHAREASDWMKSARHGAVLPVGANWQSDLRTYIASVRETQAAKAERAATRETMAVKRNASSGNYARSSPEDRRAAKAAREYPEPKREIPWL